MKKIYKVNPYAHEIAPHLGCNGDFNYDYIKEGSDPLYLYDRKRYKKPYRFPLSYYQSYPIPHLRYNT